MAKKIVHAVNYDTPPPSHTPVAREAPIVPHKMGFSLLRPFGYAWDFVSGTVSGTLDSTARWGRRGTFLGAVGMGISFIAGAAAAGTATAPMLLFALGMGNIFGAVAAGALIGLAAGALFGAVVGGLTSGIERVHHNWQRDKQADAMARAREPRPQPAPDHHAAEAAQLKQALLQQKQALLQQKQQEAANKAAAQQEAAQREHVQRLAAAREAEHARILQQRTEQLQALQRQHAELQNKHQSFVARENARRDAPVQPDGVA